MSQSDHQQHVGRGAIVVEGGHPLGSRMPLASIPGDKSISHRAMILALTRDRTLIRNVNRGDAIRDLYEPFRALGWQTEERDDETPDLVIERTAPPRARPHLFVGSSSAGARFLIAALAGLGFQGVVDGTPTLRERPMHWIVDPLRRAGARLRYTDREGFLPVEVDESELHDAEVEMAVGSAQARSALLLASAFAGVAITIRYTIQSRDHTERLLRHCGLTITERDGVVSLGRGTVRVPPILDIPGDPSLAAYPAAAQLMNGSEKLRILNICTNPTRTGFFDVLRSGGARIFYEDETTVLGEPTATLVVEPGLPSTSLRVDDPFTLHSLIDEVPLLAAVAATMSVPCRILNAEELAFKESNRLATTVQMLRAFGGQAKRDADSLTISPGDLRPSTVPSFGDHRIAMAAAVVGSFLRGATHVKDGTCYRTSFPNFVQIMRRIGVLIEELHG